MLKGNGNAMKGFLYIKDTINGLLILAKNMGRKELWGEAFNFYPDHNISVFNIVKTISKVMNRPDLLSGINEGSIKDSNEDIEYLSNHSAKSKLGWKQEISLENGVSLSIEDYKKYGGV